MGSIFLSFMRVTKEIIKAAKGASMSPNIRSQNQRIESAIHAFKVLPNLCALGLRVFPRKMFTLCGHQCAGIGTLKVMICRVLYRAIFQDINSLFS